MKFGAICALLAAPFMAGQACAQADELNNSRAEAPLDANGKQAVEGINRFSLDLYKHSASDGSNIFISPASVSTAVALAYRGARGTTAAELGAVMHYNASPQAYLEANGSIFQTLNYARACCELRVSNAIWMQRGMPLLPDYVRDVSTHMKAGLQRVDFRGDAEAARQTINRWVAAATNDKIKSLLHEGDVTDETRATLINSIYWKGRWASPFPIDATKTESFKLLDGNRAEAPLMHELGQFRVLEQGGVKAIQLPYEDGAVAMVVLLPNSSSGLPKFEKELTADDLDRWFSALDAATPRETVLTLPKMHLEWRRDLAPTLQALGGQTAFGDHADFSGMAVEPFPGEVPGAVGLKINHVIHQTYLDVDERGSEAAAATAVVMDVIVTGLRQRRPPPPPFIFRADQPFLFVLRDRRTNLILFLGRYVGPPRP